MGSTWRKAKVVLGLNLCVYVPRTMDEKDDDESPEVLRCGDGDDETLPLLLYNFSRHEIVGIVTEVGSDVTKFRVGDKAAVRCMVGGCDGCDDCKNGLESYCRDTIFTYGITVYSPLKYYGLDRPSLSVGVVGLGGLGHLAVKFLKAFGVKVTVISTSPRKEKEAREGLGADAFLVSRDSEQMKAAIGTMDGIIDTVSAVHPLQPLIDLLKNHGKLVMVGAPEKPLELQVFPLLVGRKLVGGSATGGMQETQEMIDFAAEHSITADTELIPMSYINTAIERLLKGDVKYRFVIDIANTMEA
ncbi:uncharacterized protein A4U43_C04F580 [Asparagus officinalis]|uniref:cinnamyl-alcohol dehydrogenase n=1 Tax=Asparagus officinalis TaxID=4686 RepID=A0A5P1EXA7_ASPOF|nr:uncharacterized protein A4U43_C04F580 [Asparagus officinalis]